MGRSPWTAADAPVGLVFRVERKSRTRGSGADEGVRPTANYVANFITRAALVCNAPSRSRLGYTLEGSTFMSHTHQTMC